MQKIKWGKLIPEDLNNFILSSAPTKVKSRYLKAREHYNKSIKLIGFDDEMAFIRLVASEEEIVVGIFEQLKIKKFGRIRFTSNFKNHYVKIALAPVLDYLTYILEDMRFFGDTQSEEIKLVVKENNIRLLIKLDDQELISPIPKNISLEVENEDNTVELWYRRFLEYLPEKCTVEEFVTSRANARNKILYAHDGGAFNLAPSETFINHFQREIVLLCWALGILIDDDIPTREYDLINLIILIYEKILIESKVLKAS
ncbi:MAG: hypothetical protein EPN84_11305 [Legionella sp.]|nr:MAG: hypothetical protein EPN84_11305 [Legionella sp.]